MKAARTDSTASQRHTRSAPPIAVHNLCCVNLLNASERRIIERAYKVLEKSAVYRTEAFRTPSAVRE